MPPESVGGDYNRYMLTGKPLPPGWQFMQGPIEPWFGQTPPPGTTQYMIVGPEGVRANVNELLDRGIIEDYGPPLGR
ncbi:TNT domain-containing protein (plasmid) [Mycobacterium kubicae]|nr:TNT domain-containing protein [Mycobacterium kubicae]